ncbi:MAG: Eco57I restriction-modification methylase domain-containing protein [Anaeroplasma bactoclasticum]|nr:Eco57I restriction-modification methylase domain-containing protein [Anaeroplasma bactoclasticum]
MSSNNIKKFNNTFDYKLIYIFRINDTVHKGALKIGDATIHTSKSFTDLLPNCHELNYCARKRIDEYTSTAGIAYELLHTEIAVYQVNDSTSKKKGQVVAFRDHHVHDVLKRSNIKMKYFDTNRKQNEWFIVDLETAKRAIQCVKNEKKSLDGQEITANKNPITFRPEQTEAIKKTIKRFKDSDRMLWNAKMRFGKTLSALQVAKEMGFKATIIITHRPVVSDGWYDDFNKIFCDKAEYKFGSKTYGESSINKLASSNNPFVYFASIQDLRGSAAVGGKFDKNNEIFDISWDFIVIDEAHEGTQTSLGKAVIEELMNNKKNHQPKVLELSGTPFNLLTDFEEASIYTWDYIMEQEAKQDWYLNHFGDSNPYEELPRMNIFTYHLEKYITGFMDIEDKAFNFKEFFRTWTGDILKDGKAIPLEEKVGEFVHQKAIVSFLDLICKESNLTNYPFANDEYRDFFRHTLWIVPGVKEAKALSTLLKKHHIFSNFNIVNVAGDGDEEINTSDALQAVKNAMTKHPENTYTITLSCGRLTTGVSVPEWTAVLMLAGSYSTAASQYLQTIFRVQTPANINGKIKENCYVFDFAPDRTLKMIAESVQLSARTKSKNPIAEKQLALFLNFCPVISIEGTSMKEFKVGMLLQELKKAYAERVVKNGFDDARLYNDELLKLDNFALEEFEKLKKVVGASKVSGKITDIEINKEGFTTEEYEKVEKVEKKSKKELTDEEKELLKKKKEQNENRQKAISILRAISIRMPLLVYGMDGDIDTEITIDNFVDLVDDLSWEEFMPKDVTKEVFKKFTKYYDKDMFISCSRRIRYISKTADELEPKERIIKIAKLFATFKNPDKETVLTPWRVVNMHLGNTLGGYSFFDEKFINELEEPRLINLGKQTESVLFNLESKVLEINSKTGLYPLYVAYSLYRYKCDSTEKKELSFKEKLSIWDYVISNSIFVICKTPMAKSITKRTLLGYRNGKVKMHSFDDLIMQLRNKQAQFIQKILNPVFWNLGGKSPMKFNAIVGNPPYQILDGGAQASATPVYNRFVEVSKKITNEYVSLIMPSRWMTGGKGLDDFRSMMIKDKHILRLFDHLNSRDCFENVDIKGGVCYFLWDKNSEDLCDVFSFTSDGKFHSKRYLSEGDDIFIRDIRLISIKNKIVKSNPNMLMGIVSACKPYGLRAETMLMASKYGLPDFSDEPFDDGYRILGLGEKQKRMYKYLPKNYPIPKTNEALNKFKVFIAEAYGCGAIGEVPSTPVLSFPGDLCTETFLQIGPFETQIEAENLIKYIKTKTFRALVSIQKQTQHTTKKVYRFVPMQDFTEYSDINWNLSIKEIDNQLYKKYEFNKDDIEFIENKIPNMD